MSGISNNVTYNLRKDISGKLNRLPLKYYETKTHGEILSRITNDVDTLQTSINQSFTQMITSVDYPDRRICHDAVYQCMDDPGFSSDPARFLLVIIGNVMKHSQKYFRDQQRYLG